MAVSPSPVDPGETAIIEIQAIARLKQGDLSGLEVLVRRYQVGAVHAAVLVVHDRAQAEEIVQNAFFRAAQKIHQFDERRPFGPWFLRSVINAALQEAKRQRRMVSLDAAHAAETREAAGWLIDPGLCPEDLVENAALYRAVWQALERLSPEQRAAIVMRYFQDRSEAELTEAFHRPLTTIKWWLYAARRRMRRMLQAEYDPAPRDQEEDHE